MILTLGDGITATGEPQELGAFYACFLSHLRILSGIVKREEEKNSTIDSILAQLKTIEIHKDE